MFLCCHILLTLREVIIAIYVDSFLFIFCTAVLSKAYSLNQSAGICDGAILLCLLLLDARRETHGLEASWVFDLLARSLWRVSGSKHCQSQRRYIALAPPLRMQTKSCTVLVSNSCVI